MFGDFSTVFVRGGFLDISDNKYPYFTFVTFVVSWIFTIHGYGEEIIYIYMDILFTGLKLPRNL